MEIKLYKNLSENNVIGKSLTQIKSCEAQLKNDVSIMNPTLILHYTDNIVQSNYCYIPKFNRYYFIDEMITMPSDRCVVKCRVDVLESFKNNILNLNCIVDKQEKEIASNKYINDGSFVTTSKQFNRMIEFPNGFNEKGEYILICAGGNGNVGGA